MITVYHYMTVAAILFAMGTYGVLTRRNAIVIFMCIELMLNSVNLTFIALSSHLQNMDGQVFVLFVMAVAAAEAGVGLALMITFYRNRDSIDVDDINLMKL
ncbi:MAG: NADH-quinone oxidoreductase subunit NuoK [Desulfuromonadales bacterium]|jgi:NADH-quinone oxidoreductase subunit K|nr:NADH-quinone oxidoreductase subunit NuoK [Desulfuromonadales bacterium]MDH3807144.1 NADH-quinone oxidoreductase subunit NuoK [Desulfuromonadales bacterium]MDH3867898.1 NADH-quinone oxidoreductase subunit NuoK [Desulfuromonadales bacterium]MDH3959864.1 NADH-quinone oxidoreductase subunit NuoK [Desulfuromonadales bacterium]MDH4024020.1 NADH-quinone oxidoreductase subunit NuoK [Desulfuromonadales bacterium]